jgi:hypothetical protein
MTSDKRRKARIRARMAKTGERYTTARRHVIGAHPPPEEPPAPAPLGYRLRGGLQPDAAGVANVLAHAGATGPDGAPLSEALVFGVMGGLGAGYILWEFAHDNSRALTLGFRNQWQYHDRSVVTALDRLGIGYDQHATRGAKKAARTLDAQFDAGRPAIVWPDRGVVGYWRLPAGLEGHGGHPIVVIGPDDNGRVHLDDRTSAPLTVPRDVLDRARGRVGSYKNTLIDVRPQPGPIDTSRLRPAIIAGVDDCVGQLGATSTSFALPAWRKWSRLLTDPDNAKSWPQVFADGVGLSGALLSVWEGTSSSGMAGGHLRHLYADFLTEVAPLLGVDVDDVVDGLRVAAELWTTLGATAIGTDDGLRQLRDLTVVIRHCVAAEGDAGASEALAAATELWKRRAALDADCPLSSRAIDQRFADMSDVLRRIHDVEARAVTALSMVRDRIA